MVESGEREVWMHVCPTTAQLRSFQHGNTVKERSLDDTAEEEDVDDRDLIYSNHLDREPTKGSKMEEENEDRLAATATDTT